jgi:hypothetical protein
MNKKEVVISEKVYAVPSRIPFFGDFGYGDSADSSG